jgi:hypothetical protein
VFACIGDRDDKNRDFVGKMAKLDNIRYASNTILKHWKADGYWGFEVYQYYWKKM